MKTKFRFCLLLLLLVAGGFVHAQTPGFDDDVQDVPVHQGIVPMVFVGALLISIIVYKNKFNTKQFR